MEMHGSGKLNLRCICQDGGKKASNVEEDPGRKTRR